MPIDCVVVAGGNGATTGAVVWRVEEPGVVVEDGAPLGAAADREAVGLASTDGLLGSHDLQSSAATATSKMAAATAARTSQRRGWAADDVAVGTVGPTTAGRVGAAGSGNNCGAAALPLIDADRATAKSTHRGKPFFRVLGQAHSQHRIKSG